MRFSKQWLFCLVALGSGSLGLAAPITYTVTVDSSPISGTAGSLDFSFNPGPLVSQAASVRILNFNGNGMLGGSFSAIGDASGSLPGTVTFDNGTGFNDYFQAFTFGSTLTFQVSLFGPALSSPDGISTSGSTFTFSMFSDAAGTVPALTTDAVNGFAFVVDVNLDGTTTATSFLPAGNAVPEPGTAGLCGGTILAVAGVLLRRRRLRT